MWSLAGKLAAEMVAKAPDAPRLHSRMVFGWRARTLGPEVAASDYARAKAEGWTQGLYDFNGRVLPVPTRGEELRQWIEASLNGPTAADAA